VSKISELSDGGSLVSSDYLIAVRSGGNVKVRMDQINVDQVDLGDNEFIRLGNSQDLTMVHTSTQSIINQAGIGDLLIQKAGATKLTINASGIDVTGSVTADGLTVDDTSGTVGLFNSTAVASTLAINNTHANAWGSNIVFRTGGTDAGYFGSIGSLLGNTDQDLTAYSTAGNGFRIYTNGNNERLRVTSAGSVGIGTSSPSYNAKLDVNGIIRANVGSGGLSLSGNAAPDMSYVSYNYTNSNGTEVVPQSIRSSHRMSMGNGAQNAITFDYRAANAAAGTWQERLRVDASGNLLVGKTTLDGTGSRGLELRADGLLLASKAGQPMSLDRTGSDGTIAGFYKDGAGIGSIGVDNASINIGTGNTGLLFYNTATAIYPRTAAGAQSNGAIDLGGASDRFKDLYLSSGINLNTASTAATITMARGTNGHNNMMKFSTGGTDDWIVGQRNDGTSDFRFYSYGTSSDAVSITRTGNLLVGTSYDGFNARMVSYALGSGSSDKALVLWNAGGAGSTFAMFVNSSGVGIGTITQSGTTAVLYNTSSDQRLKDNIVDAPSASDDIDAIQVRSFDWKTDGSHQKYGMVAQELQSVAPEAVSAPEDPEEMMGVDYSKLVPMMLKEIQSLRARIAALES
jgi:hypothetical protein